MGQFFSDQSIMAASHKNQAPVLNTSIATVDASAIDSTAACMKSAQNCDSGVNKYISVIIQSSEDTGMNLRTSRIVRGEKEFR